ncbi:WD repeat-containing protein 54 isoform X1 [Phascolarctos cinereus]|uniref:WD repeat-containing protein 54 n=1 Tax=Phascolarctos cinereus TaxID=38626 RepID=A0A6P5LVG0_PHACI|nr:WD repeat-containing protein 54 [Phascolarctos cinereus]XP_020861148.1 WD repeat-containing protein 54 [Phascolarctos cinereus]XP_020861149.1 WD repeat-containing protein 54 [Phascolarctos cinereus]
MYRREQPVPTQACPAALYNNLCVLSLPAPRLTQFALVHGLNVQLLSATSDGLPVSQRQLHAKEGAGLSFPLITQAYWCVLPFRVLLVLTSQRGIQMYESDGSVMVYWHALDSGDAPPAQALFARGIAASGHYIFVGTWSGRVLVFDVPAKGPNIVLSEELDEHRVPITDIAAEPAQGQDCVADVVTADDSGLLCVWKSGPEFKLLTRISGFGSPCPSVRLWQGTVAAGYGDGQIRVFEASSGALHVQINAHARGVSALDLAPEAGKLLSGAEDSFVHIWKLSRNPDSGCIEVEHCHAECVTDTQVCGARFCDPRGSSFAVTGYDLPEILRYSCV